MAPFPSLNSIYNYNIVKVAYSQKHFFCLVNDLFNCYVIIIDFVFIFLWKWLIYSVDSIAHCFLLIYCDITWLETEARVKWEKQCYIKSLLFLFNTCSFRINIYYFYFLRQDIVRTQRTLFRKPCTLSLLYIYVLLYCCCHLTVIIIIFFLKNV